MLIDSVRPLPRPGSTRSERIRAHFEGFSRHVADAYGVRLELPYDELVAMDDDAARIDVVLRALREAADVPPAALEHQRSSYLDMGIGESHSPAPTTGRWSSTAPPNARRTPCVTPPTSGTTRRWAGTRCAHVCGWCRWPVTICRCSIRRTSARSPPI